MVVHADTCEGVKESTRLSQSISQLFLYIRGPWTLIWIYQAPKCARATNMSYGRKSTRGV